MFVQIIQGRTASPAGIREASDRWVQDLAEGAVGWLGSTAGVTQDGRFIALVRFESEEAARANSNRPEQDAWWAETSKLFDGEVTFHDGTRTRVDLVGDPEQAGFVQVVQGRVSDQDRARERLRSDQEARKVHRPDVLGSVTVEYDDGGDLLHHGGRGTRRRARDATGAAASVGGVASIGCWRAGVLRPGAALVVLGALTRTRLGKEAATSSATRSRSYSLNMNA